MIELYIVFWNVLSLHCWKMDKGCAWNIEQEYSIQVSTAGASALVASLNRHTSKNVDENSSQYVDDIQVRKLGADVTEDFNRTARLAPIFKESFHGAK